MKVVINDNRYVFFEGIIPELDGALDKHFSASPPNVRYIDLEYQRWDGLYRRYSIKYHRLPLPLLGEAIQLFNKYNVQYEICDRRTPYVRPDKSVVTPDFLAGITLDDYQIEAIQTAIKYDFGIICIQTGGGKTEVIAGIIKALNRPTVVIAEQRVVIEQLKDRLELREVVDEVGLFYGGETPSGQTVIVGSIQSLNSPPRSLRDSRPDHYAKRMVRSRNFQEIVKNADVLIVDECDRSSSYKKLFESYFGGRFKYGMSATPFDKRKPVENLFVKSFLGPIIYSTERSTLEDRGRIITLNFIWQTVGEFGDKNDNRTFDIAEKEVLIEGEEYIDKVKGIIESVGDERTLILVDTGNIEILGKKLESEIPGSIFIYGKTSKTKRNKALRAFESGEIKVLIGGRILKRGLDLKSGVDNLIMCGGGNLWSDYLQKIGRALRLNNKGSAKVFDFLVMNNKYLWKHSRERLKCAVANNYPGHVLWSGGTMKMDELVKKRWRLA